MWLLYESPIGLDWVVGIFLITRKYLSVPYIAAQTLSKRKHILKWNIEYNSLKTPLID